MKATKSTPALFENLYGEKYSEVPYSFEEPDLYTREELIEAKGDTLVFDVEVYQNYFLAVFKSLDTGKVVYFEMSQIHEINRRKLKWVMQNFIIVGFNSRAYDHVIIQAVMREDYKCRHIKLVSDDIIQGDEPWYKVIKNHDLLKLETNHIDIMEVAPLKGSLKVYAGRMHAKKMQDLPYHPDRKLSSSDMDLLRNYCFKDVDDTILLYRTLEQQIQLRKDMSVEYRTDLRSKSDAQVAEAVIAREMIKRTNKRPEAPEFEPGFQFKYDRPESIQPKSDMLKDLVNAIDECHFELDYNGKILMPPMLDGLVLPIGQGDYRMGIGGLHSSEQCATHVEDDDYLIFDHDVTSYYPSIILNQGLYPKHLGEEFLEIYRTIVERRIEAKKTGDKVTNESLKITINGSFGKFGNKYSILFAPQLLTQVTLTGQLALLMLIENLELQGISVVSANTDGIVVKVRRSMVEMMYLVIKEWEGLTGFNTEESRYRSIHSRDVNNYIAVKHDGSGCKTKGCYSKPGLQKNPVSVICVEAVTKHLLDRTPINDTIRACTDVEKFISVRKVQGGAVKDGVEIGKVIRWYFKEGEHGTINYCKSGNKVPGSDGAWPLMELSNFPTDIDYNYYIKESKRMLKDIGCL